MADQMNNPLKQVTHPTEQFMRKKNKDNKKYSKNTKLKVIIRNDVVGEHDAIMKRKASYSCVCEDYEGGFVQAIPALIFLHVIEQDKRFDNSLKYKLKDKMTDFNDRVHKISSQMQKFGDFFFFKSRKNNEEQTYVKQGTKFEIDKITKKITKINVVDTAKQEKELQEVKEIKQLISKMQHDQGLENEDHNDFNYFPFINNVHQKINYQNTLPISSKDLENELLKSNNKLSKQKTIVADQQSVRQNPPSVRQSFSNIPDSNQSFSMYKSQQIPQRKNNSKLRTQKSLQDNLFANKLFDNDSHSIKRNYFSSQRAIPGINDEDNNINNNISNFDCNNQQMQTSQLSIDNQNNNNSRTSIDDQSDQKTSKSPIRSQSRRTIIINDKDLINEEEENHQTSSSSSSSKSIVSPISQKFGGNNSRKAESNAVSILLEQDKHLSLSPQSSKMQSPLIVEIKQGSFKRKQKKALTIQGDIFYDQNLLTEITKSSDISPNKRQNMYIDEEKPLQYFEHRESLSPDNKFRGRQTLSVYQSRKSESNFLNVQQEKKTPNHKQSGEISLQSKRGSQSRIIDLGFDEFQNKSSHTPKNMTGSSAFSNRNSSNMGGLKSNSNASLNVMITDKLLQRAIGESQNLKNQILKEKEVIQVADLKSTNRNELKSLMEIKNLQKRMTQKQDPTKYDELLKPAQMRVLDLNIKLSQQRNKSFLDEERQRIEKERNSLNEDLKEQIIRKTISKIGLVSPQSSINFSKLQQQSSPAHSFSMNESAQSGSLSTGRNILRQTQLKSQQNHPLSNDSLISPLNNSLIKYKEQQRKTSKKLSQFNLQAAQNSSQTSETTNTPLVKQEDMESPIVFTQAHSIREDEMFSNQVQRNSFINYNEFAYTSPQNSNNRTLRRFTQQQQYIDPLNIGLKNNSLFAANKYELIHSYQDEDSMTSPHTGTNLQKNGKKNKIHFKSSVDEYLELKAKALSNNFDKKKIKTKDLPFLDSYANQLQINLKRLFYLKLKENYCKETGFENVQQRVADQMLDKNFQQFLKNNKDILPEKKNLNYLYNWRKSESPKKSLMDKIQHQMHSPQHKQNSNQNFLKGNIPVSGFLAKNIKLPNLHEKKKQGTENHIHLSSISQGQIHSSIILDRQNQSISKYDQTNGGSMTTTNRNNISSIFQNEGRDKIITERAKQFYENLQNIQEKKKKEQRHLKTLGTIELKQTYNSQQNLPTNAQFGSIVNIDLLKKMSYKEFKDVYHDDAEQLQDLQEKARNDLINLDKFFKNNQRAENALKNDNLLIKKMSTKVEDYSQGVNTSMPQLKQLQKQSTLDNSKLEEDFTKQQNDNNEYLLHEKVVEEDEEESPMKNQQKPFNIYNKMHSSSGTNLLKKNTFTSPSRYRILPKERGSSQKQLPVKTVEEEMNELTHSIILKYGLQSKFKNKLFK